jgi:hypothetical protein
MQVNNANSNAFTRLIAKARHEWDILRSDEQIEADEWLRQHMPFTTLDLDLFLLDIN